MTKDKKRDKKIHRIADEERYKNGHNKKQTTIFVVCFIICFLFALSCLQAENYYLEYKQLSLLHYHLA
ncbi:hypothetical protein QTL97_11420 [Sporosarcina thermotolerans]|uniref:Uncharacterized protein n=1 Tax=Sporosarcina thermotolerans TaxID=633404 RepID=A0AAW9AAB7_9BACL|nr:hypothetical protein [Sporosarcina thermotolerans]MDW0117548.1 hypothetical protein [Sporosarcina thermotolerans]WHT49709.1 hypothetical protein QNH10_09570 [Sporosarcina thermotolerans]